MIGFLFPAMLLGLTAVAVPIVIHFFYRRQLKVIPISTLRFLKIADETLPRQPRLQHLLLLLLRCLLVAMLAFFLARPYFVRPGATAESARPVHRVILLDRSMSMAAKGEDGVPFDEARKIADRLARGLRYQDGVTALAFDQNPVPLTAPRCRVRERVLSAFGSVRAGANATSPRRALQDVQRRFNDRATGSERNEAVILTDLCSVDVPEWIEAMSFVRESKRPGRVVLVQCASRVKPNFAIASVRLLPPDARRASYALAVQVSSSARQAFDRRVETVVNDRNLGVVNARSATGEAVLVEVPLPAAAADELWRGSARLLEDDPLPPDNQRCFCFKPSRSDRVFLVDGVPSRIRSLSETYYLNIALNAFPDDRAFSIATGSIEQLPWDGLERFGTILFANVGRFTPEQAAKVAAFVRRGGNAIFTLGDRVDADAYNRVLRGDRNNNLLPAVLGPVVGDAGRRLERFFLGDVDPGFDGFNVSENANVEAFGRCNFFAFHDLQNADPRSHVLARFNTGQPFLLESSFGDGRVYLFASSLAAVWNDFPLRPTYLPFWRNFLARLAHAGSPPRQFLVGDTAIVKPANAVSSADRLLVLGPDRQSIVPVVSGDSVVTPGLELPGLYRVTDAAGAERDPGFAVNIPARESSIAPATAEDLARLKGAGFDLVSAADAPALTRLAEKPGEDSAPLAVWIALLAVAAAAGEWMYSNRLSKEEV